MYNQRVICRSVLALYIDLTDSSDNADPASPYTVSVGNPMALCSCKFFGSNF